VFNSAKRVVAGYQRVRGFESFQSLGFDFVGTDNRRFIRSSFHDDGQPVISFGGARNEIMASWGGPQLPRWHRSERILANGYPAMVQVNSAAPQKVRDAATALAEELVKTIPFAFPQVVTEGPETAQILFQGIGPIFNESGIMLAASNPNSVILQLGPHR